MEEVEKLILDNQKLVYYLFNHRIARSDLTTFYREEIIGDGFVGLVKAAKTYDPSKGTFSTWAGNIIVNEMLRGIRRFNRDFEKTYSLDSPVTHHGIDGGELTLGDVLEGQNQIEDFENKEEADERKELFEEALGQLKDRDRKLLEFKAQGLKQGEIGEELGMSRAYVSRATCLSIDRVKKKIEEIEKMKVLDPNSPKASDYKDKGIYRKDYARYSYLKSQGRADEFVRTPEDSNSSPVPLPKVKVGASVHKTENSTQALDLILLALEEKEKKLMAEIEAIRKVRKVLPKILEN